MSQRYIELNGKRYDATTGALVRESTIAPQQKQPLKQGKVIDGFVRPGSKVLTPQSTTLVPRAVTPIVAHPIAKPTMSQVVPTAPLHHAGHAHIHKKTKTVTAHHPEHAKTLMRHTVQKPEVHIKPAIKTQVPVELPAKLKKHAVAQKLSASNINVARLERAKAVVKHTAIQRFNTNTAVGTPAVAHRQAASTGSLPVIPVRPHPTPTSRASIHPERPDMFETAMHHARSHEEPAHKPHRKHSRLANNLAIIAIFLVMAGFITYINLPSIEIHVASINAGFSAHMPGYTPTGYALEGGVHRTGGTVSMRFVSGDSSYMVTEQPSNWNNQTLADNTAAASEIKSIEHNGKLIYIYGGSNAAWVSNNVRYNITGDTSMSLNQLIDIATSM